MPLDNPSPVADPTFGCTHWFFAHYGIALGAVIGFVVIAFLVETERTQSFDETVLQKTHQAVENTTIMRPQRLEEIIRDWTALGGYGVLTLLMFGMSGYLVFSRRTHMFRMLIISVVLGTVIAMVMKGSFQRERPNIVEHKSNVSSTSFPSGHAMMSMVTYLTLGSLLARISHTREVRIYCLTAAILLSVLVGFSRICVGVHYPTDVLAGWLGGIAWVSAVCLVTQRLEDRGIFNINR